MLLIYNALLLTMAEIQYERGYVWLDPPLIRAVGSGDPPTAVLSGHRGPVLDAGGGWLLPGFIDAHCHVGLFNDGLALEGEDGNESSDPITPQLQALDGLYQDDRCFAEALAAGITGVMTGPGSANVLSGQFAFLNTGGRTADRMAVLSPAAMKAAFGENPKKTYGHRDHSPMTRMATAALLREALTKAVHYRSGRTTAGNTGTPEPDMRWEALLPVLDGRLPLKIHAHRSDDILTAVRVANEFGLRYTIDHCTEGYKIADILADEYHKGQEPGHGCGESGKGRLEGVIAGPILSDRSKPELAGADIRNPAILADAGIPLAIMTDHPVVPIQYLPLCAAMTVRAGLPEETALAAITRNAARLCGLNGRLGSIESGKQADLALFSGHPFDYRSQTRWVFLQGRPAYRAPSEKLPEGDL